jgi:predicted RNase H-like HicB family nuclease
MEDSMEFNITIDRDEDGAWIAEFPTIPGCVGQGHTKYETIANTREAIQLCLEVRSEQVTIQR